MAWRYLFVLSGGERVKPDTMVVQWLHAALRNPAPSFSPQAAAELLEQAASRLQQTGTEVSVRAIDHLVW